MPPVVSDEQTGQWTTSEVTRQHRDNFRELLESC